METLMMRGKPVAEALREKIEKKIEIAKAKGKIITLAILTVGNDAASHVYKNRLIKLAESLGAEAKTVELAETSTQEEVETAIKNLNADENITGILPMMPLPKHLDGDIVGSFIAPEKDMDCLNPSNVGNLYLGHNLWAPCTPRACMATLDYYGIELKGKNVVVLGRSNVVGKPVGLLLLNKHATVTICHSRTVDLTKILQQADIVVAAIGVANFVKPEMVKDGVVIVDVGINATDNGLCGDVASEVAQKASAFTPVPGGIGVVSNMMVMETLTRNL